MRLNDKKVLLINPPTRSRGLDNVVVSYPLGLAYLAAMVEDIADVYILDAKVEKKQPDDVGSFAEEFEPDIVGISNVMSSSTFAALEIAKIIRTKLPNAKIVFGGHHATFTAEELLRTGYVDIVVRGEGEETFRELVYGRKINKIKGISYITEKGSIVHNPSRPLIDNLDNLPFPARHKLKKEKYHAFGIQGDAIETSRGCPFNCSFCCVPMFHGKKWRARSPESILTEIMYLVNYYNTNNVFFIDDNFTADMKRVNDLCKMILKSRIKVNFFCQARADSIVKYPKVVENMRKAGFWLVFLGLESPFQEHLDLINKKLRETYIRKAVHILKRNDIAIWGGFIIGFPGETEEMIRKTVDFAEDLDIEIAQFTLLTPLVGSPLYEKSTNEGLLLTKDWSKYNLTEPVLLTDIAPDKLRKALSTCYKKFYLRPKYVLNTLFSKHELIRLGFIKSWRYWVKLALIGEV